jgi:hypothetical protein
MGSTQQSSGRTKSVSDRLCGATSTQKGTFTGHRDQWQHQTVQSYSARATVYDVQNPGPHGVSATANCSTAEHWPNIDGR